MIEIHKDPKLVGRFFEDRIFYRLLTAVPLKMYGKFGRPKWILVSQMLKLVGKWAMGQLLFLAPHVHNYTVTRSMGGVRQYGNPQCNNILVKWLTVCKS